MYPTFIYAMPWHGMAWHTVVLFGLETFRYVPFRAASLFYLFMNWSVFFVSAPIARALKWFAISFMSTTNVNICSYAQECSNFQRSLWCGCCSHITLFNEIPIHTRIISFSSISEHTHTLVHTNTHTQTQRQTHPCRKVLKSLGFLLVVLHSLVFA